MLVTEGKKNKDVETLLKIGNINRHINTLHKEMNAELKERNAVENSSKECLVESLREVLKLL